jgi:hypothetical protein
MAALKKIKETTTASNLFLLTSSNDTSRDVDLNIYLRFDIRVTTMLSKQPSPPAHNQAAALGEGDPRSSAPAETLTTPALQRMRLIRDARTRSPPCPIQSRPLDCPARALADPSAPARVDPCPCAPFVSPSRVTRARADMCCLKRLQLALSPRLRLTAALPSPPADCSS